jgi:hypothetical protein
LQVDVSLLLLAAVLWLLSLESHAFGLNFGFVVLGYGACRLAMSCRPGQAPAIRWKFAGIVAACLAGVAVLWACTPERIAELMRAAREGQGWDRNIEFPVYYYGSYLRREYAFVLFLMPLGLFRLWSRDRAFAVFVGLSFAVLLLLHSFLYFTKQPRYILYAMPFLLLAAAAALDVLVASLADACRRLVPDGSSRVRAAGVGVTVATVAGFCYPMYVSTRDAMAMHWYFDYKVFHREVGRFIPKDAVIVSTEWEDFCYYFGREPDHYLRRYYAMKDRDTEKRITTESELERAIDTERPVYLLTRLRELGGDDFLSKRMAALVSEHFVELGESGEIRYFVDNGHYEREKDRFGQRPRAAVRAKSRR